MTLEHHYGRMVRRLGSNDFEVIGLPRGAMSPTFEKRTDAEGWLAGNLDRLGVTAQKRGPRDCLRCKAEFESEGIHNRLCPRCRAGAAGENAAHFSFTDLRRGKRA